MKNITTRIPDDLLEYLQDEAIMAGETLSSHVRNKLSSQQIKRMVLVDYENLDQLGFVPQPNDKVLMFVGASQFKIRIEDVLTMQGIGERGEYVIINKVGPNALDFCLTYTLGKLRVLYPYRSFAIVSNDSGFDAVVSYMREEGAEIERIGIPKKEWPLNDKVERYFKGHAKGNPKNLDALKGFLIHHFPGHTESEVLNTINYFIGKRKLVMNGTRLGYYF